MTLQEWAAEIAVELRAAGFDVSWHQGFPLIKKPEGMDDTVALLKWSSPTNLPCAKSIYADGMLITPGLVPR